MSQTTSPVAEFSITRVFDFPIEQVWAAYSDEAALRQWWGPAGFEMVTALLDFRAGGSFLYCMKSPDGHEMWGKWAIDAIEAPRVLDMKVCFSDKDGGITRHPMNQKWPAVTGGGMVLTDLGGKTSMTITIHPVDASEEETAIFAAGADEMRQGFTGTLDRLDAFLSKA